MSILGVIFTSLWLLAGQDSVAQTVTFNGYQTTVTTGLSNPLGVAVDGAGNVYIADSFNNRVVKVPWNSSTSSYGTPTTVPTTGLLDPGDVAVDGVGDVYIADTSNNRVVEVPWNSSTSSYGAQTTVSTSGLNEPFYIAVDGASNVYIADYDNNRVVQVPWNSSTSSYGTQTTVPASGLKDPFGIAVDGAGNVYVADSFNIDVVKVPWNSSTSSYDAPTTVPTTGLNEPFGVAVDGAGNVYIADAGNDDVVKVPWNSSTSSYGTQTTVPATGLNDPFGVAVDGAGNVYIADHGNDDVVKVATQSVNLGMAAVGSAATPVTLGYTFQSADTLTAVNVLTQGANGKDYTADATSTCKAQAYNAGDTCNVVVDLTPAEPGLRMGAVQLVDSVGVQVTTDLQAEGTGPLAAFQPGTASVVNTGSLNLSSPYGAAMDGAGNVYIADYANNRVVEVTPTGTASVVSPNGLTNGTTYDGCSTTGLCNPTGVAVDGAGNLYIVDNANSRVVEMTPTGATSVVSTPGLTLRDPFGVAVDGTGDLYIADIWNNRVVEVTAAGVASVVNVGTPGGEALNAPQDVAVDGAGNLYISDAGNNRIVEMTPAGVASVVNTSNLTGGNTAFGCNTTGLCSPGGVAVDAAGNLYIADYFNSRVVEVTAGVASVLSTPGLTGGITSQGFDCSSTSLCGPFGVAVDGTGDLYIADYANNRVVEVNQSQAAPLSFANTVVGQTSADSPQNVMVENIGNQPLSFTALSATTTGQTTSSFNLDGSGTSCDSSTTLNPGATCDLGVEFLPASLGIFGGMVNITDNNLNAASPNYATQTIMLSGTGVQSQPQTITFTDNLLPYAIYNGVNLQYTISATGGGSGNAVTFSIDSTSTAGIASLSGSTLTITGIGTVIIDANQAAGGNYAAATQVQQSITVTVDTPATIAVYSGNRQSARVGSAFANNLTAQVIDGSGTGVYGVTVTFWAPSSGAGATLSPYTVVTDVNGLASVTATANGTAGLYLVAASYPGSGYATFTLTNLPPPVFTVTSLTDDATGAAGNCNDTSQGATPNSGCSLRDAIAAAAAVSTSTLTPTVNFASSLNLTTVAPGDYNVTTGGTLNIGNNINITGPGANLLSIDGGGTAEVFNINSGTVSISGLSIVNGSTISYGAGIENYGALTVTSCTFSGNNASGYGGGIANVDSSTLTVSSSTFSGNNASGYGGGIANMDSSTLTVGSSTFSSNSAVGGGGGIFNVRSTTLTVSNSTFSGNTTGIYIVGSTVASVNSSTFSGNTFGILNQSTSPLKLANNLINDSLNDEWSGFANATHIDNGGNVIAGLTSGVTSGSISLAPLGNYGGATQTMPPLPGSVAICAGLASNIPSGITTDQRGNPRSTTAYGSTACVDAGAVQTAYSLGFTSSPSDAQKTNVALTPAPAVQLSDNGSIISLPGAPITLALNSGAISGGIPTVDTAPNGVSTFSGVTVTTAETGDYLIARAPVGPYSIEANSSDFNVIAITLSPARGALTAGTFGSNYSAQFTASGGTAPYIYSGTNIPSGLGIASSTGVLGGVPNAVSGANPFSFTITVTDAASNFVSQSYTLAVGQAQSTISVSSSANPAFVKNTVTYTAAVGFAAGSGTTGPTGLVSFFDGGTPITACTGLTLGAYSSAANAALATCAVSYTSVTPATHSITASYAGDTNFTGSISSTFTETVADFAITAQNATLTVEPGSPAVYTFTVSPQSPATTIPAAISFTYTSVPALPAGWTVNFSPNPIPALTGSTTVTMTVDTTLTASATQAGAIGTLASRLAPFSLALLLLPFAGKLRKSGKRFSRMISVLLLLGASLATVAGVSGCGSNTGFFSQAQKSYTVTVTAASGTLSRTSNVTLTVE
jgi:CSLREA domain-containing protein